MRKTLDDEPISSTQQTSSQDRIFTFTDVASGWYILGGFAFLSVLLVVIEGMRAMQ